MASVNCRTADIIYLTLGIAYVKKISYISVPADVLGKGTALVRQKSWHNSCYKENMDILLTKQSSEELPAMWLYYNLRRMFSENGGWCVQSVKTISDTLAISQSTFFRLRKELKSRGMMLKIRTKWRIVSLKKCQIGRITAKMADSALESVRNFKAFAQEAYSAMRVRRLNSRFTFRCADGTLVKNRGQRCGLPPTTGAFALSLLESDFGISKKTAWARRKLALDLGFVKFSHKHEIELGDIYAYTEWRLQNQEWSNLVTKRNGLHYLTTKVFYSWSPISLFKLRGKKGG